MKIVPSKDVFFKDAAVEAPVMFIALEPKASGCAAAPDVIQPPTFVPPDEDTGSDCGHMVALMLTRRCNMACGHCSVESSPHVKSQPSEDELLQALREAARGGARAVQLTGGEPMIREAVVMHLLAECRELGLLPVLTTNAFWGKSPTQAAKKTLALSDAGVVRLTISYDRFHAEFQGPEPAVNILRAAQEMNLPMQVGVNFTRTANDDLMELVAPFEEFPQAQMRFYDVQLVGRARELEGELRDETGGFCIGCKIPTITDDGRVTACNGPAYFSAPSSPLVVGSLSENSLPELLARHRSNPILDTIRTFGPSRLRRELQETPGFEDFKFHEHYSGMCDLCLHLTSEPAAMAALQQRLSTPRAVAERLAAKSVMRATHNGSGELSRDFVNSIGACRVFMRAALEPEAAWAAEAEKVLGRPDFDWNHHALHLMRCGLSLPLQKVLNARALSRWAPPFFTERLRNQGLNDGLQILLQREALGRIAQALRETGAQGVLLKGTAMMALDLDLFGHSFGEETPQPDSGKPVVPGRSSCDIDILIAPDKAPLVREKLLQMGFKGKPHSGDTAHLHQLEALSFEGFGVEIHQTLQPAFCGLPEREMLTHVRPLQKAEWQGMATLDAEGMFLHSAIHLSKHLFAHGLKTAWDFVWLLDRFPDLDWKRLGNWAQKSGMRRGFWVPVRVLCRELAIAVPAEFLNQAPADKRQHKLEKIARRHLFGTTKFVMEDNPWVCQALYAAMSDSWIHRGRCLHQLFFSRYSTELRRHRNLQDRQHRVARWRKLRQAFTKWQQLS